DRAESDGSRQTGSKRHLVVDRHGIPLAELLTAANVHETTLLAEFLDAIPPIRGRVGAPRRRPDKLHGDKPTARGRTNMSSPSAGARVPDLHPRFRRRWARGASLGLPRASPECRSDARSSSRLSLLTAR